MSRPRRRRLPGGTGRGRAPAPRLASGGAADDDGPSGIARLLAGTEVVEEHPDGDWVVRRVTGTTSTKPYTCPGCLGTVRPGAPHVVAWRAEAPLLGGEAVDARRHWHTRCWQTRRPGRR